jgi:hypothetical protein
MAVLSSGSFGPWYVVGFLFPLASVFSCWIVFYALGHNGPGRLFTISETVLKLPENRIFAVTMNLETVLLFLIFFVRNRILQSKAAAGFPLFLSKVFAAVLPVNLSILSLVTLEDHAPVHLLSSFIFFFGCILYFIVTDSLAVRCGFTVSKFSRVLTWLSLALFFAHTFAMGKGRKIQSMTLLTIGALFQYDTAFAIFLKIAVFRNDLPKHSVKLSREKAD